MKNEKTTQLSKNSYEIPTYARFATKKQIVAMLNNEDILDEILEVFFEEDEDPFDGVTIDASYMIVTEKGNELTRIFLDIV